MDKLKRIAFMLCLLLQLHPGINANPYQDSSKNDSIKLVREFFQVCASYKQAPLFLSVNYTSSTNYISNASDTGKIEGVFYLTEAASYVRFGEMEELVTDSLAVVVSSELKRMILFTNTKPILRQMKAMLGMEMPDSSIKNFCKKYSVFKVIENDGRATIYLNSRALIYSTELSKERITITYEENTQTPVKVITLKRSLVPLSAMEAEHFSAQPDVGDKLIRTTEGAVFLIKEQSAVFDYQQIEHGAGIKVPVLISERISKNTQGSYVPAKLYENFIITEGD